MRYLITVKCMNDKAPQYLCDNFEQRNRIHNRNTRRNGDLDVPKFRTSIGQRSFKYRGTKIWRDMEPLGQPQRRAIRSFFNDYTCTELACKQTLRERTSAVKYQNWDSAPLHKLIKNFPYLLGPLHKLIKIPRHSPLIKLQNYAKYQTGRR